MSKYKAGDIVFTRGCETIIITGINYDCGDGFWKCEGVVPSTGAVRYYFEENCYDNISDYEKDLLQEVSQKVESQKKEIKLAQKKLSNLRDFEKRAEREISGGGNE